MVFVNIVLPVFIIIAVGFTLGKVTHLEVNVPSKIALYVFAPALYFNSMYTLKIEGSEVINIFIYCILMFALFVASAYLISRILGYSKKLRSALILSAGFPNSGNYGLPVILFAFAQAGLDRAVIFAVFQSLLSNSAGVYFASNSSNSLTGSLKNVLKMPVFIGILAAIVMRISHVPLPGPALKSVEMLGQASIPTLLVVLGMQLSNVKVAPDWKFISTATIMRLFAYPLAGMLFIPVLFVSSSLTAKVMLVLSAVPSAAIPSMLAIQYDTKPELVSTSILVTTLVSIVTVPLLLRFVM